MAGTGDESEEAASSEAKDEIDWGSRFASASAGGIAKESPQSGHSMHPLAEVSAGAAMEALQ